jgi:hypothetical protein
VKTLAGRVTLIVTLAVVAVWVVVGAVALAEIGRRERSTFDRELLAATTRAELPAREALRPGGSLDRVIERTVGPFSVRVTLRGTVVYDDLGAVGVPIPPADGIRTVRSGSGERWRVVVRAIPSRFQGRLVVSGALTAVEERIADTRRTLALAFAFGVLACGLVVPFLTARTLLPLRLLRERAAAGERITPVGVSEVDTVADAVNALRDGD